MSRKWSGGLGFGRALFVLGLAISAPAPARATELRVELHAADGRVPDVKSAAVLAAGWGWTERLPVQVVTQGQHVVMTIPLDERFDAQWPAVANTNMESTYLFVEGRNFVPFLAGKLLPADRTASADWTIDFPRGLRVGIKRGETRTVRFAVRTTPQARAVRFVDAAGRPVQGVRVTAHVGWDAPSHCLSFSPSEPAPLMDGRRSDARGVVRLPDGDFPYVLPIDVHEHQRVSDRDFVASDGALKTTISGERLVRVRTLPRRPLSILVLIGDEPVLDFSLYAPLVFDGCGVGGEQVFAPEDMRRSAGGQMTVRDFYPDEVESVCLGDSNGHVVWRATRFDQPLIARLPVGTALGEPDYSECATASR